MSVDFQPVGIQITAFGLSFFLRYYGMLLMLGALAAAGVTSRLLKIDRADSEIAWDGLIWVLVFGVVGARLYHVFTPSLSLQEQGITTAWYLTHPLDLINTTRGGLGMPGAIMGGVFGLYLFARRRKLPLGRLMDSAAPGVALAQAIGRWGNFVNQELYGPPTDLPWGIPIRPENRLSGYGAFERFHPLFLYESIWNLASMFFLLWMGGQEAWHAWVIGERSDASPWRPILYPFKAVIPVTAALLLSQGISEFLKSVYAVRTGRLYSKREAIEI